MGINLKESSRSRADKDTENFRNNSRAWFVGVEVVGSGGIASLTAGFLWDRTTLKGWQVTVFTFLSFVVGLMLLYVLIWVWNLFRAPYKQRNEVRTLAMQLQETFSELDIIDGFMSECSAFLSVYSRNTISMGFPIPDQLLVDYRIWFKKVSDWLEQRNDFAFELWARVVDISNRHPTDEELRQQYELGYQVLQKLKTSILSASRKEDSQKLLTS